MSKVTKDRSTTLSNKEQYLRSLNVHLEHMPEHCIEDLDAMLPGQIIGLLCMALSAATGYVALTSAVLSIKKDF